ncbi:hypothetical protein [Klebsiella michiganensis]|uniref:hypothetical protein n=1 Tax=Klebsiella michiganensis TaxID=1134687 RepID=UPI0034D18DA2
MDNRERELYELSSQIAEKLTGLPDDGQSRSITVTQSGDGTIVLGSQVIINTPVKKDSYREIPIQERPNSWILSAIKENKSDISAARRRKWFGLPTILFSLTLISLTLYFINLGMSMLQSRTIQISDSLIMQVMDNPIYLTAFAVTFGLLGFWMDRARKIEDRIIAESSEAIASLTSILRRRQG